MTYALVQDVPASWERFAAYAAALDGEAPAGLVVHVAGPTDEGFRTIGIWESEAAWRGFDAERLDALRLGVTRPIVTRAFEVAHVVVGALPVGGPARPRI
jgi:hypothetical protein